jgi:hypothetical protein
VDGFSTIATTTTTRHHHYNKAWPARRSQLKQPQQEQVSLTALSLSSSNNQDDQEKKLQQLGISKEELQRSRRQGDDIDQSVRVDLVEDVDPLSLTAVGFGLIAINFFILANLGDGGIAGTVARIINAMNN